MAAAFATTDHTVTGQVQERVTVMTCDNSYPSGGYPFTATQLGLPGGVDFALAAVQNDGGGVAYVANIDVVNGLIKLYQSTGELANATNCSSVTVQILARGGY